MNNEVSAAASALVIAASDKAGMDGIDRSKIDAIILRESGDSSFIKQQRKRDAQVNQRIEKMLLKLEEKNSNSGANNNNNWKAGIERELQAEIQNHVQHRQIRSTCVVVDMDMFYMACELLSRPGLDSKPCCVGQGMILTSNYTARKYGVRSAMAGWIGDKLVEELSGGKEKLIHIPSNFRLYQEKSNVVQQVLAQFDPNLKAYSLDEAYLDVGPYTELYLQGQKHDDIVRILKERAATAAAGKTDTSSNKAAEEKQHQQSPVIHPLASVSQETALQAASKVIQAMRHRVFQATDGLTCSAGLAPNFMLAKIASDRNKPNGQCVVGPAEEEVLAFLHPLPTRKVPGIGRVTEKMLHALRIQTVKDLFRERATVRFLFQPATARFLLRASLGCGSDGSSKDENNDDENDDSRKGISRERTFASGRPFPEVMSKLEDIAQILSQDMASKQLWAKTITLKVKLHTFDVFTRSKSMPRGVFVQEASDLVSIATGMLREVRKQIMSQKKKQDTATASNGFSVRLLGVRCSNFQGDKERDEARRMNIQRYFSSGGRNSTPKKRPLNPMSRKHPNAVDIKTTCDPSKKQAPSEARIQSAATVGTPIETRRTEQGEPNGSRPEVNCPICNMSLMGKNNAFVNRHIDSCQELSVTMKRPAALVGMLITDSKQKLGNSVSTGAMNQHAIVQSEIHCPICRKSLIGKSNAFINWHIDRCLNGGTSPVLVDNRKKHRLTDFFGKVG